MPGEIIVTDNMITCSACGNTCTFNREKPWKSDVIVNCPDPTAHGEFAEAIQTAKAANSAESETVGEQELEQLDFGLQTFGGVESARARYRHLRR